MANTKTMIAASIETGLASYITVERRADGFLLNDADGDFANVPVDLYVSATEDSTRKGMYQLDESRVAWDDGEYIFTFYKQVGGSPAPASDQIFAAGTIQIKNDLEIVLDDSVAAIRAKTDNLPDGIKKNTALPNFQFQLIDSTDGKSAKTGAIVTAQRSINGGAFTATTNSVIELSNGVYIIDLSADDLNGDIVTLLFTASGAIDRVITILTQI